MRIFLLNLLLFFTFITYSSAFAQGQTEQTDEENTITVFLDCRGCNETYIRNEISYVNFVRDKEDAQVHLLVTRQWTGSGGREFTLRFLGSENFEGRNDTLKFISLESDTQDEERRGLVKFVKIGLMPYLTQTDVVNNLDVSYQQSRQIQTTEKDDRWNNWVFELSARSYFNGDENRENIFLSGGVSARRITEDWKIRSGYDYDYNRRSFTRDGVTNIYTTIGHRFNMLLVRSLSDHWSAGFFGNARNSTRDNLDLQISGAPAVEYNIFPYAEYAQHEISFLYTLSAGYYDYEEITIFNKTEEYLVEQRLTSRLEFTQPWGQIEGRLAASSYLHDFNKNRLDVNIEFDIRVFRGLSVNLSGRYAWINNQLAVPAGDINDAEQLLNLRQQSTSYSFGGSVGIEYTFGSIYNNVVNPRF